MMDRKAVTVSHERWGYLSKNEERRILVAFEDWDPSDSEERRKLKLGAAETYIAVDRRSRDFLGGLTRVLSHTDVKKIYLDRAESDPTPEAWKVLDARALQILREQMLIHPHKPFIEVVYWWGERSPA